MASTVEIFSSAAAVASAVGGAFAAWAAFRSAKSAQVAQDSAERSERRVVLREVASIATEILVEVHRVSARGSELRLIYRSLATMSGMSTSSSLDVSLAAVDEKVSRAIVQSQHAELFANGATNLQHAPPDEIDRVQLRLSASLTSIRATLQDLDREYAIVEGQSAERRQSMDRAKYAR
jgi:hypothetical protein